MGDLLVSGGDTVIQQTATQEQDFIADIDVDFDLKPLENILAAYLEKEAKEEKKIKKQIKKKWKKYSKFGKFVLLGSIIFYVLKKR